MVIIQIIPFNICMDQYFKIGASFLETQKVKELSHGLPYGQSAEVAIYQHM